MAIGQGTSLTLGAVAAPATGATVSVPITVTNFSSVGSITLKIAYNPAVVTFTGVANAPTGVSFTSNAASGVITLIWYDATGSTPLTIASGKLVDLNFSYISGSGTFTFNTSQCEVTTGTGSILSGVTYTNGAITSNTATTLTLGTVAAPVAGGTVSVPITVANLISVGSITLKIAYNTAVVTFMGVANAPTGVSFTSNAASGVITLIWYDATGSTPLTIASGKLVDLNFTYISGTGTFTFNTSQCEVTTGTGTVISGIAYFDGSIGLVQNQKPTFTSIPAITKAELDTVRFVVSATDPNPGDVLTYSASGLPTGATFTAATRNFFWVPALGQNGTYTVKFRVSDGQLTDSTNAVITITKTNLKPTLTAIPAITKAERDTVKFVASATDPNPGDILTYSASGLPTGATFTAATQTFLWVPSLGQNGSYTIKILVTDGQLKDSTNAVITITKTNVKPTLNAIPAITKAELDTVKFIASATDPNPGDVLTYSTSGLPTGATFTAATQTFLWVPSLGQNGSYTIKIFVTDGQLKDSTNAVITVTKVKMIVKNPIADMTLDDNPITHRTVKIKLTSPPVFTNNIGVLNYTATSANTAIVSATILTPDTLQIKGLKAGGPVLVTVTAKDVDNSQITDSINVTVTGSTGVDAAGIIPTEYSLSQNYPNPFNPSTSIQFGLPAQAFVTMEIYNILGVKVRTLLQGAVMSAGIHQMEWNGKDDAGASVTSGVYLYRINAGTFQVTKKMMMLK
jgi:hypothetical protein